MKAAPTMAEVVWRLRQIHKELEDLASGPEAMVVPLSTPIDMVERLIEDLAEGEP